MSTAGQDRLFVPLTAEAFGWWKTARKRWELRVFGRRWNGQHVVPDRRAELRRGYSGPSLWGKVGRIVVCPFEDLRDNGVEMLLVAPASVAWIQVRDLIGACSWREQVIAFEVLLDPGQGVTR